MCTQDQQGKTRNMENEKQESVIDERLRNFFHDGASKNNQFKVVQNVMDVFLHNVNRDMHDDADDGDGAGEYVNDSPILIRSNENNDDDDDDDDDGRQINSWSHLFYPLFSSSTRGVHSSSIEHGCARQINNNTSKRRGQSFKIVIAYQGSSYCGWQIQPNNHMKPSVQQTLVDILNPILQIDTNTRTREKQSNNNKKAIDIRVCGRTDAGVSATGQICRVRTQRSSNEISSFDIQQEINQHSIVKSIVNHKEVEGTSVVSVSLTPKILYCSSVERVSDKFHPTFGAKCRAYVYLIDQSAVMDLLQSLDVPANTTKIVTAALTVDNLVRTLNEMTKQVEGKELDYFGLSFGKVKTSTTLCTMLRARVSRVTLNEHDLECNSTSTSGDLYSHNRALCFEFVGDRFLRRMIRIIVSTLLNLSIQSLIQNEENLSTNDNTIIEKDAFLELIKSCDRQLSSKPAAPDGLIFLGGLFDNDL